MRVVGEQRLPRRLATHVRVVSAGSFLPDRAVSSAEVEDRIAAASPGARIRRGLLVGLTGVENRHYAADDIQASDLAVEAVHRTLQSPGISNLDVDLLIWASASQDLVEPATAHIVAAKLGLRCPVFDVKNACNSFLNGIQVATALLGTRAYRNALVVTGETPSRAVRWSVASSEDYVKNIAGYTMGDAGAAVLLEYAPDAEGMFHIAFHAVSQHWDLAMLPAGGSMHPRGDEWTYFTGDGPRLRDAFLAIGSSFIDAALDDTSTVRDDFVRVFCHQVTLPFLELFCATCRIDPGKLELTLPHLGNIASATIPTQLARALEQRAVSSGDQVMCIGLAGGLSLATILMTL